MPTPDHSARTARNVTDSDGTLIIAPGELTGGTRETLEFCLAQSKPHLVINASVLAIDVAAESAARFVESNRIRVLNVAGPRASQWPSASAVARQIVAQVLRRVGGQAGSREYSS